MPLPFFFLEVKARGWLEKGDRRIFLQLLKSQKSWELTPPSQLFITSLRPVIMRILLRS